MKSQTIGSEAIRGMEVGHDDWLTPEPHDLSLN